MGSSVHAQGPYKHLTPGNPDFKKGATSVFSATSSASSFLESFESGEMKASASTVKGSRGDGSLPSASPSPSSSRFSSLLWGANLGVSLSFTPQC